MSENYDGHVAKIEAGQALNPDPFPTPNELACIQVPKVLDQVALRDCITRDVVLSPGVGVSHPAFSFEGTNNFFITEVKIISKTDLLTKPGFKKLKLSVKVRYDIIYSDGVRPLTQTDEVIFNLSVNEIYCPGCLAQNSVVSDSKSNSGALAEINHTDGVQIKVESLVETFGEIICPFTGALILNIGAFFMVKCKSMIQLLVPSLGYCMVPVEQASAVVQNSATFNDRFITPFTNRFIPG